MYHIVKVHPVIPDVRSRRQERGDFSLSLLSVLLISVPVQSRCMPVAGYPMVLHFSYADAVYSG